MTSKVQRTLRNGRALAAGLGLAVLLAQPALAEVRIVGDQLVPIEVDDGQPAFQSRPGDGFGTNARLRPESPEQGAASSGSDDRPTIGSLMQLFEGGDALDEAISGIIEDAEGHAAVGNRVHIGTSTDIAIGAGARACSRIGGATCR